MWVCRQAGCSWQSRATASEWQGGRRRRIKLNSSDENKKPSADQQLPPLAAPPTPRNRPEIAFKTTMFGCCIAQIAVFGIIAGSIVLPVHGSHPHGSPAAPQKVVLSEKLAFLAERTCLKQAYSDYINQIGGSVNEYLTDLREKHVVVYNVKVQEGLDDAYMQDLDLLESQFTPNPHVSTAKLYRPRRGYAYMQYNCIPANQVVKHVAVLLLGLPNGYLPAY